MLVLVLGLLVVVIAVVLALLERSSAVRIARPVRTLILELCGLAVLLGLGAVVVGIVLVAHG